MVMNERFQAIVIVLLFTSIAETSQGEPVGVGIQAAVRQGFCLGFGRKYFLVGGFCR